jgi:hypothetical protein
VSYEKRKKQPYLPSKGLTGDVNFFKRAQFHTYDISSELFPGLWPLHGYMPGKRLFRLGCFIIHAWDGTVVKNGLRKHARGGGLNSGLPPMPNDGKIFAYYIVTALNPDDVIPENKDPLWVQVRKVNHREDEIGSFYGVKFYTEGGVHAFTSGTREMPIERLDHGRFVQRTTVVFGPTKPYLERVPGYKVPKKESPLPCRIAADEQGCKGD